MPSWTIRDQYTTANGGKMCYVEGPPQVYNSQAALRAPFGPSAFQDPAATRLSLDFSVEGADLEYLNSVDAWTVDYVAEHSLRLLNRAMTKEQVHMAYKPLTTAKEGHAPLLRTKVNLSGTAALKVWTPEGFRTDRHPEWRHEKVKAALQFKALWVMGSQFGWTVDTNAVQLQPEEPEECPF